jgi:hypothetical protein
MMPDPKINGDQSYPLSDCKMAVLQYFLLQTLRRLGGRRALKQTFPVAARAFQQKL